MNKPKIAGNGPCKIDLEQGKKYAYCTCGLSESQPLCDGNHKGSEFKPVVFEADESKTVYMCLCKHTANGPLCDGTHKTVCEGSPSE